MDRKLGKGIMTVLFANIINLVFSLATNFVLPKYLSVDSYAGIKTFQLYISYVGLLHFGYVDSIYLKYGGNELRNKTDSNFYTSLSTFRIFQISLTICVLGVSLIAKDVLLEFFALTVFPLNMNNYFKFLYQATGKFEVYGRIMNMTTASTFIINMFVLFVLKSDAYIVYVVFYVVLYYILWFVIEAYFRTKYQLQKGVLFSFTELVSNIRDGILLTVGNLASTFLTSMDRWFVKFLMDTLAFAQYSFAVSVESFLNLAVTPVTTTLYNYFCRETEVEKHRAVLNYIFIFATILPCAAFPAKLILEIYLQKYIDAAGVIFILFSAQMFYIIIKSVFVNLYKVQRKQKVYFIKLVVILVIGFVFNSTLFKVAGVKESFAVGTLMAAIIWFFISVRDFKYLEIPVRAYIFLFAELLIFLVIGFTMEAIIGFFMYIIGSVLLMWVFMRQTLGVIIKALYTQGVRCYKRK